MNLIIQTDCDIHATLAERREIAIIWCIDDVKEVRPDLNEDQCWQVLQNVERHHDATVGISWEVLDIVAGILFGDAAKEPDQ